MECVLHYQNNFYCPLFDSGYFISHHGIKGQKWGIRRFQNFDMTWTPEGKIRYGRHGEHAAYQGRPQSYISQKSTAYLKNTTSKVKRTGKTVGNSLIKNIKGSKANFDTYVLGRNEVDRYLKAGIKFSRVQTTDQFENFGAYYATYKKSDVDRYIGLFGKNLRSRAARTAKVNGESKEFIRQEAHKNIYQLKLKTKNDIKVASDKNASKVMNGLLKNKEFKHDLVRSIDHTSKGMRRSQQQRVFIDAKHALKKDAKDRTDKDKMAIYKAFNLSLTNHESFENNTQKAFYKAMRNKGYGAISDLNDKYYSSYHAKNPMIVFGDKSNTTVDSVRTIGDKEMDQKYKYHNTLRIANEAIRAVPDTIAKFGANAVDDILDWNSGYGDSIENYVYN